MSSWALHRRPENPDDVHCAPQRGARLPTAGVHVVFERDGFRCTVPGCTSRRNLQGHHIRFRSQGGTDALSNKTTLCGACHAFGVHKAGIVRVRGRAPHRLFWELGRIRREDGSWGPRRRYLGEFRRDLG